MAEPFTHTVTATVPVTNPRTGRTRVDLRCSAGDLEGRIDAAPPEVVAVLVDVITKAHGLFGQVHTVEAGTCTDHGERFTGTTGGSDG